jgi:hypothetical protein
MHRYRNGIWWGSYASAADFLRDRDEKENFSRAKFEEVTPPSHNSFNHYSGLAELTRVCMRIASRPTIHALNQIEPLHFSKDATRS